MFKLVYHIKIWKTIGKFNKLFAYIEAVFGNIHQIGTKKCTIKFCKYWAFFVNFNEKHALFLEQKCGIFLCFFRYVSGVFLPGLSWKLLGYFFHFC